MPLTKFIGFAPDIDPTTPGVITDCQNIIPTTKGCKSFHSASDPGVSALSAAAHGFKQITKLNGSKLIYAGTGSGMYKLADLGTSWTDVTSGGPFTAGTTYGWTIEQFGDVTLASATNQVMVACPSTTFAAVSGAPTAAFIAVSAGFVMAANIGSDVDRWKCCAYNDYTDWTLSASTQCVTGRLVDTAGPIYGLKALGDRVIAYKEKSIYVGEYVGSPEVWRWNLVQANIGTMSNKGIVDIGNAHLFIGADDFYMFDGIRPVPLNSPLREWFRVTSNQQLKTKTKAAYDEKNGLVYWFYPRATLSAIIDAVVYNIKTNEWGSISIPAEEVCIIDGFYDSSYAVRSGLAVIDNTHTLKFYDGVSGNSYITTGNIGDDTQFSLIRRATPRFIDAPTSATMTLYEDNTYGDSFTSVGSAVSLDSNGRFDVMNSARWHKCKFDFTGDVEIVGVAYDLIPDGEE